MHESSDLVTRVIARLAEISDIMSNVISFTNKIFLQNDPSFLFLPEKACLPTPGAGFNGRANYLILMLGHVQTTKE